MYLIVGVRPPLLGLEVMLDRYVADMGHYCSYPVWPELRALIVDWNGQPLTEDSHLSGVLADYLQDHRVELLEGATGPTDPGERLDGFIEYLRIRFCPPGDGT